VLTHEGKGRSFVAKSWTSGSEGKRKSPRGGIIEKSSEGVNKKATETKKIPKRIFASSQKDNKKRKETWSRREDKEKGGIKKETLKKRTARWSMIC